MPHHICINTMVVNVQCKFQFTAAAQEAVVLNCHELKPRTGLSNKVTITLKLSNREHQKNSMMGEWESDKD